MRKTNAGLAVLAWSIWMAGASQATNSSELGLLSKEAAHNRSTKEGYQYETQFLDAIDPILRSAMDTCTSRTPDTIDGHPADFVFVVRADGRVRKLLYSTDIPFGQCIGAKLRAISRLPTPPHDSWAVALGVANHSNAEKAKGPPDQPQQLQAKQKAAYQNAIAQYVAKARATYPAAKKRFLVGLPSGHKFFVRVPLFDHDGKREDTFVNVESINNGEITGIIASNLGLIREYKTGQRIAFPESKIDNWLILRPDGTEEGNYVGKFLDHYKP